jgi:hypothetical protein
MFLLVSVIFLHGLAFVYAMMINLISFNLFFNIFYESFHCKEKNQ